MTAAGMDRELVIEQILKALNADQKDENRWEGLCPAHDDHNPSLGIYINADGYIGFKCYSRNCPHDTIVKAIETKFGLKVPGRKYNTGSSSAKTQSVRVLYPAHENTFPFRIRKENDIIYEYYMPNGDLAFVVQRYDDDKGKKVVIPWFSKEFISLDGVVDKSWEARDPPKTGRPIFNLNLLEYYKDKKVLIVEGEKTALVAMNMPELKDYVITTWSGGSSFVRGSDWQPLKERQTPIYLWPDFDDVGIRAMKEVAKYITTGKDDNRLHILDTKVLIASRIETGWDLADGFNNNRCSYSFTDFVFIPLHVDEELSSLSLDEALNLRDKKYRKLHLGTKDYIVDLSKKIAGPFNYTTYSDINSLKSADNDSLFVEYGDKGKVKQVSVVEQWYFTRNAESSVYLNGVKFDPTTEAVEVLNEYGGRSLNIFPGFPKFGEPSVNDLVDIFLEHIEKMIEDKDTREWMLDYFADIFQNPGIKPGTAILLLGRQGVGKSVLIKALSRLLGALSRIITKDLFNSNVALSNALLVHHDEWSIDLQKERVYYDALKNAIDNPKVRVSEKYLAPWESDSFCRFIFTSNSMAEITFPPDDRRFTVIQCNDCWLKNTQHFTRFFGLFQNDAALSGLLQWFKDRTISYNITQSHVTKIKEDLWRVEDPILNELVMWADGHGIPMDIADELGSVCDFFGSNDILIPRSVMRRYMNRLIGKQKYGNLAVGTLKRVIPGPENKRHITVFSGKGEGKVFEQCFVVPKIRDFRDNLEKELKTKINWSDKSESFDMPDNVINISKKDNTIL